MAIRLYMGRKIEGGICVLHPVPDYLRKGLTIVFIGFNPGLRSGELGHHYAGRGNRFWKLLHESGLTPRLLQPQEDHKLLDYNYGLTNIVERVTRTAAELTADDYAEGRVVLHGKLQQFMPQMAVYVGKGVYEAFSGTSRIAWGLQAQSVVAGIHDYVVPSSSGLVRMPFAHILDIYRGIRF